MLKYFPLLIKPTSADCNLNCGHCFYLPKKSLYPGKKTHRMTPEVMERMVSLYMATEQPQYMFLWQGGEPALMGVDFYRRAVELQKKYGKRGDVVCNSMQTNATLIDNQFAEFMGEYKFLVGVSLDGPEKVHDTYRKSMTGKGSHVEVMKGIECLKRNRVEFNVLTLVTSANVKKAKEVYNYLCAEGFHYQQYIPCVEFDADCRKTACAITGREWGDFLYEVFDEWHKSGVSTVSVRLFDSALELMANGRKTTCCMEDNCCKYLVVEHNGDVYPCDFFVEKDLRLGNIMEGSWEKMIGSDKYMEFGEQKSQWNEKCGDCGYVEFCFGDCLKHRVYCNNSPGNISWLCDGWKQFYDYSIPKFENIISKIQKGKQYDRKN